MYIFTSPRKYVRKSDAKQDFKVTRGLLAVLASVLGIVFPILLAIISQIQLADLPSAEIPTLTKYSFVVFGLMACFGVFIVFFVLSDIHRQRFEANLKAFENVPDGEMLVRTDLYGRMLYVTISMIVACDLVNALFVFYVFNKIQSLFLAL